MDVRALILLFATALPSVSGAQYYQSDFPPEEFRARWEKLLDSIGDDAVALVQGGPSTRGFEYPRQSNSFYYLSGIETPHSYLWFDGRTREIAGLGMMEAIRSTVPGAYEYQLDAAARYVFLANGARLEAYRSITASGTENIANWHYYRNTRKLESGDLVLMDYAPDYGYYVSDIGRMWPVSGRFTPVQRELLEIIRLYRDELIKRIRPGVTTDHILEEAETAMAAYFRKHRFSKDIYEAAAHDMVENGRGAFSHLVGMAVHDVGEYRTRPLRPGLVFSVDPTLRVPQENLYLRYEDTVVVTEDGVENFTDFLPARLDDIEALMREEGVLQKVPVVGVEP